MKKYIKKHLKDEKRILLLMFRKGVFKHLNSKHLGWDSLLSGKKGRKRKGTKYKLRDYLPQLHCYQSDYWGEWDSKSVVEYYKEELLWGMSEINEQGYPIGKLLSNKKLISHLKRLKSIKTNNSINKYLKIRAN